MLMDSQGYYIWKAGNSFAPYLGTAQTVDLDGTNAAFTNTLKLFLCPKIRAVKIAGGGTSEVDWGKEMPYTGNNRLMRSNTQGAAYLAAYKNPMSIVKNSSRMPLVFDYGNNWQGTYKNNIGLPSQQRESKRHACRAKKYFRYPLCRRARQIDAVFRAERNF